MTNQYCTTLNAETAEFAEKECVPYEFSASSGVLCVGRCGELASTWHQ